MARDPYCGNCGYSLKGLTESSKCPECGKPIVEVLERPSMLVGRRYTSEIVIFGLPLIQIALGPHDEERVGRARGIIAIGDHACGWLAIGGFCRGLIAVGGFALGIVAIGGGAVGVLSLGGFALGVAAMGGLVLGGAAVGGLVFALVAVSAGLAIAWYARAGFAYAVHGVGGNVTEPEAIAFFREHAWLFGAGSTGFKFMAWMGVGVFLFTALLFLIVLAGHLRHANRLRSDLSQMR
ncbi:MAG: hypothetical protein KKI02_06670 [Planctomycetes bacterium]|nr:hypothetical protein [Planctomycetota bacterium]